MTHERAEKEMDEAIEAIVRRAMAELRALNRGCVCALWPAPKRKVRRRGAANVQQRDGVARKGNGR